MPEQKSDGYQEFDIHKSTNVKLCDIIVSSRYLGILQDTAVLCMEELAIRRSNGDEFDYETYIAEITKKLPNFKTDLKKSMKLGLDFSILKNIK